MTQPYGLAIVVLSVLCLSLWGVDRRITAMEDRFQADLNLLNGDMQALDYLRTPAPLDEPIKPRTEYFL